MKNKNTTEYAINGIPVHCSFDELVPIRKLKPHPKNRNKHPKEQVERLVELIKYQGIRRPVTVSNQSEFITVGHGFLSAAKKLKLKEVPVNFQDYESEEQEYAHVQSDNAIAAWADLDLSDINLDVPDLGPDFDIDMLGIKDFTIDPSEKDKEGLTDDDAVPENVKAKTKTGDLWLLGDHRLLCGDCTDKANIEKLMQGEKAMMWASDPPYGINHVDTSQEKGQSKGYKKIANDDIQDQELQDFIFRTIENCKPHLQKGFAFYMWHAMKMQGYFAAAAAAAAAADILFHRQLIWVKPQFVFGRGQYHWRHELCLMGWLKGNIPPFYGEKNQSTVWEIGRENDKIHPTQKPVAIWEPGIKNHTKPGEIILEPFMGSGSNLIACEKTNRKCYGMEIDPHYCDVIVKRWEDYTGKKAILERAENSASKQCTKKANGKTKTKKSRRKAIQKGTKRKPKRKAEKK